MDAVLSHQESRESIYKGDWRGDGSVSKCVLVGEGEVAKGGRVREPELFCFARKPREGAGCHISQLGVIHKLTFPISTLSVIRPIPPPSSLFNFSSFPVSTPRPFLTDRSSHAFSGLRG